MIYFAKFLSGDFTAIEITHDSNFVIAGDNDGSLRILNIPNREEADCIQYEPEGFEIFHKTN